MTPNKIRKMKIKMQNSQTQKIIKIIKESPIKEV
jgi:hypothetical protein